MAKSRSYKKALRAAKSVVRGTTKRAGTAAAGLALVALPGCLEPQPATVDTAGQVDASGSDAIQDLKELIFDTLAPDVLAEVQSTDSTPSDTTQLADTSEPDTQVSPADTTSSDAPPETDVLACITSCLQPTDKPCKSYKDCEVPEVIPGTCSASGTECTPAQPCPDGESCDGFEQTVFAFVNEQGQVMPWSPIDCKKGLCHVGAELSEVAQACCADTLSWCEGDLPAGCSPWGPPAPPAMHPLGTDIA